MDKRVKKWLYDVSICIEEIEGYIDHAQSDKSSFVNNLVLCRAMERSFEIIGEALNRIAKENPSLEIRDQSDYIGLRNIIAHGYDVVSYEKLWQTAIDDVPILKKEVEKLLNQ